MSGFDPHWLALREPADHRARNRDVLAACAAHFRDRAEITVVDLGCGAGSNLRGLAPHLPALQRWRLVDHDAALLDAARTSLCAWADHVEDADETLRLVAGGKTIEIDFVAGDLAREISGALGPVVDLVTAAAFFDLVSESWIQRFRAEIARRATPLYAAITYNGEERWTPPHPLDADMLAAFHAHQSRDKGLGTAAGPRAAGVLERSLSGSGFAVRAGASDWALSEPDGALVAMLADGIAAACTETALLTPAAVEAWRLARETGARVKIGHVDLFARPGA